MMLKFKDIAIFGILLAQLSFGLDWVPQFDDKPLTKEQSAQIDKALPQAPIKAVQSKRRVLLYSATAGYRHPSIVTGKAALARMGASSGAYEAIVSDDPANFERAVLREFDAVVLLSPTRDFFMPNSKQRNEFTAKEWVALRARHNRLVDNLIDYLEAGGGLVGIHAATDACYGHEDYGEAMGGYFNGHPWMAGQEVTIVVEDPEHALTKPVFGAMKDFRIREEIYQFKPEPYSRERLRILLNLDPERSEKPKGELRREDNDYPVCWVQQVGQGRVFYSSIGHNHAIYWNPLMLKHYLAGIQFACGDLPADTTPSAKLALPHVDSSCHGWVDLFEGESLKGWIQRDGKAIYEVRDGAIVGTSVLHTPNSFLCTERVYGDFELEFEVKCGAINSGVQIRSQASKEAKVMGGEKQRVNGPQVEIEHSPGQAGYIYGEAYSSWRSPEPKSKDPAVKAHRIFRNNEWNHYRIVASGSRIQTSINGEIVADLTDAESFQLYPEGFIGLQVHSHSKAGVEIHWRNIRIRELGQE
jgi:type 1 glutamine amidotransferase